MLLCKSFSTLSIFLTPSTVAHEHLKERGLFGLHPPPPGANSADYYHLMASHRSPYGDLIAAGSTTAAAAAAAAAVHLPDYINPMDSEFQFMRDRVCIYIYMHEGVK